MQAAVTGIGQTGAQLFQVADEDDVDCASDLTATNEVPDKLLRQNRAIKCLVIRSYWAGWELRDERLSAH